jgi:hypothetical protein
MLKSRRLFLPLALFLLAQPCVGDTDVPDLEMSEANIAYVGPGVPSLLLVPDGSGNSFTEARDEQGQPVDATITLYLRDFLGNPFYLFPREDMWLQANDGNQVACGWGMLADQDTDVNGMTFWVNPQPAGGFSEGPVFVFVNGEALYSNAGLPLKFRSPDLNGDLQVNLTDVAIFVGDYYGGFQPRSDLSGDGVINLSDIAILAQHYMAFCP